MMAMHHRPPGLLSPMGVLKRGYMDPKDQSLIGIKATGSASGAIPKWPSPSNLRTNSTAGWVQSVVKYRAFQQSRQSRYSVTGGSGRSREHNQGTHALKTGRLILKLFLSRLTALSVRSITTHTPPCRHFFSPFGTNLEHCTPLSMSTSLSRQALWLLKAITFGSPRNSQKKEALVQLHDQNPHLCQGAQ